MLKTSKSRNMGLRWTHKEIKKERLIRIRMSNSIVKNSDIAELLAGHGESTRQPTKLCDRRRDGFSVAGRYPMYIVFEKVR